MARDLSEMDIRTTLVPGDYDSFRAALTRSIIGVTFKKFKRLGSKFFATKSDNVAIVDAICKKFYEQLQAGLSDIQLKHLKISTSMKLKWDRDGRIVDVSNVHVGVLLPIGELVVDSANVLRRSEKIKLDFFYSPVDFRSQAVRKDLDQLVNEIGNDLIERHDYDYLQPETSRMAEKMGVKLVPAVVLNDEDLIEDPSKPILIGKINEHMSPYVNSTGSRFVRELTLAPISRQLTNITKNDSS